MFSVNEMISENYPQLEQKPWRYKLLTGILRSLLNEKEFIEFDELYPHLEGVDFVEQVLDYFDFSYSVRDRERVNIPNEGRVVIIANHPLGSLDGLALLKMVSETRPDVKVVANQMLMALKPLHSMLLPVNNMQGGTPKKNIENMNKYLTEQEGAVIIFPSGEVSRIHPSGVKDSKWHRGFLRMAKATESPIVPIFMDGTNSPLFYGLSMLFKPLGTALLVKEMFKQRSKNLPIRIGEMIPPSSFNNLPISLEQQIKLFKRDLYTLKKGRKRVFTTQKPIALPEERKALSKAIENDCTLLGLTPDNKKILQYKHTGSSPIMREIGRLREIAFRAVGEGTEKRRDTDKHDASYFHLILWDEKELEIVGAYRIGDATQVATSEDFGHLYSASLFDYQPEMAQYFAQGLELGRSFIQPKYWGKRALDYLWMGIGAFIEANQQYRYLFGPVSLSNNYPDAAKQLLVSFYQSYFPSTEHLAEAKHPVNFPVSLGDTFNGKDFQQDFTLLKQLLSDMGYTVPTLFKQYSDLCEDDGVKYLAFSIDPDFNDCIDGLVFVDLGKLKAKKHARYMPKYQVQER